MVKNMERQNKSLSNRIRKNNAGFTLVELVVVLVLLAILMGVTIFGGVAWQDWMRFQHEDSVAEELFFAAQNQLVELDASGATEREFRLLQKNGKYSSEFVLAYCESGSKNPVVGKLSSIIRSDGQNYTWETLWSSSAESSGALGLNVNQKDARTILTLSAKSGDYDRYVAYLAADAAGRKSMIDGKTINLGTVMLFDLVAAYVSDTSALNGAIILELSPETGQVFSALYSDRADQLSYNDSSTSESVSVLDRQRAAREPWMLGYYGVDQLTERIRGKGQDKTPLYFEIRNSEVLEILLHPKEDDAFDQVKALNFMLYDGTGKGNPEDLMSFSIPYDDIPKEVENSSQSDMLVYAAEHPVENITVTFYSKGDYAGSSNFKFRFPAWIDEQNVVHIVLDAADVQAQTSVYGKAREEADKTAVDSASERFRNTYSFYRFGLADTTNYIFGKMTTTKSSPTEDNPNATTESVEINSSRYEGVSGEAPTGYITHLELYSKNGNSGNCGECTTFASYEMKSETKQVESNGEEGAGETATVTVEKRGFEIQNGRHLYNMRYETECKRTGSKDNVFCLTADIDWNSFVGKTTGAEHNYFLNSYDASFNLTERKASGIDYDGENKATGSTGVKTANMPFPGFRCLGKGDTFTQAAAYGAKDEDGNELDSYSISNVTVSLAANIAYGVYDDVFDNTELNKVNYSRAKFLSGDITNQNILGMATYGNDRGAEDTATLSVRSHLLRGGALPLGLFAENLGTISNITLSYHTVRGFEESYIAGKENSVDKLLATNMVGGFAGNNLGYIANLTLGEGSKVNGRTDVGGIIGRESYIVTDSETNTAKEDVTISGMKNFGEVSGLENVGGIVGRAYTHFIGESNQEKSYAAFYYDGNQGDSEFTNPRYYYYHDRYFISDNNTSMTGARVARVGKITIENCSNRGLVHGDLILGYGAKYQTDGRQKSKCCFIGGIAGVAMDGYIADHRSLRIGASDGKSPLKQYEEYGFFRGSFSYIEIDNCDSYYKGLQETAHMYDYYVGGLVGYLRYAYVKGCVQAPEDALWEDGAPDVYVSGKTYVGGLFGCSDNSIYLKASDEANYAVVNYNNVIGEKYVGGIAGGTGIGDKSQQAFSIWNPSSVGASIPSQYVDVDTYSKDYTQFIAGRDMLNTAVVLGKKSDKPMDPLNGFGCIGGIYGVTRLPFINADNIQSQAVKKLAMKLITSSGTNLYSLDAKALQSDVLEQSAYGGNCVGGIIGHSVGFDWMNDDGTENCSSRVDAIVFGQDYVGGVVGHTSDSKWSVLKNTYPFVGDDSGSDTKGLLVVGRDGVGGICGDFLHKDILGPSITLKDAISVPFRVAGRYGVGGLFGLINPGNSQRSISISTDLQDDDRIQVLGVVYTGGVAGVVDRVFNSGSTIVVQDMDINSAYFAGGLYGAVGRVDDPNIALAEVANGNVRLGTDVKVEADAFSGGVAGLFAGTKLNAFTGTNSTNSQLRSMAETIAEQPYQDAFNSVMSNTDIVGVGTKDISITFNNYSAGTTSVTGIIQAKIFAGGLFGFSPDRSKNLAVTGFVNGASIRTTGAVTNVAEMTDKESSYSYLGGVIGRVPKGMILVKCGNAIGAPYVDDATPYYAADQATWLGGLTEVNAGQIVGQTKKASGTNDYTNNTDYIDYCINNTNFDYSSSGTIQGVGAFTGVNGTIHTDGSNYGVIFFCSNRATIKAKVAAGIAGALGGSSDIRYSENRGRILGADVSAGIAGVATSGLSTGSPMVTSCVNLGDINLTESGDAVGKDSAGIVYSTDRRGVITYCRNYGPGVQYGITGEEAARVYANAEAGGLGADLTDDPIAPMDSDNLTRNFFLYGEQPYAANNADLGKVKNYGSVYYTVATDGYLKTLMNKPENSGWRFLNLADGIDAENVKCFTISKNEWTQSGTKAYDLNFTVHKGQDEPEGVNMKDFTVYWYSGVATNQAYQYHLTFSYKDSSNISKQHTFNRKVAHGVKQTEARLYDTFQIPSDWSVTGVRIWAGKDDYEAMLGAGVSGSTDTISLPLYSVFWSDSDGKHYMVGEADKEQFPQNYSGGQVVPGSTSNQVKATIIGGSDPASDMFSSNKLQEVVYDDHSKDWAYDLQIYDKKPNDSVTWTSNLYPVSNATRTEDSTFGNWLETYYDENKDNGNLKYSVFDAYGDSRTPYIDIDINRPSTGLNASGIKLYLYNLNYYRDSQSEDCYYRYLVTLTFYDRFGQKRTAQNQRMIYLDSTGYSTVQKFSDTVLFGTDNNNDAIKPVNIRIEFNPVANDDENAFYYGIAGVTYIQNEVEKVFASETSTGSDTASGDAISGFTPIANQYVDGVSLVPSSTGNANLWKLDTINTEVDTWSKQLYVQEGQTHESYHFIYKRNGEFQNDVLMPGLGEYSGGKVTKKASLLDTQNTMESRLAVFGNLDKKLLQFLKDETGQKNSKFVDEP